MAKEYWIYPATKQHSKKQLLNTIKLYKEVASNISLCINPCNPPHTVAIATTRKRESKILFGSTHPLAKMLQQISEKNFLYCLIIFPPTTDYHKIFKKQNVKLSYSCMPNMGTIIAQHNKQVLNWLSSADTETPPCNCLNKRDCLLEGKCCAKCVIYKAWICTPNGKMMSYYGCCETDFKAYYYNHKQSFKTLSKRHQT